MIRPAKTWLGRATVTAVIGTQCWAAREEIRPGITDTPSAPLPKQSNSIWVDGPGSGFRYGTHDLGLNVAYGRGGEYLGSSRAHDFVIGTLHGGWIITDPVLKDTWLRGNWEFLIEGIGGYQLTPRDAALGAVDLFLRYNFSTHTRLVPFFEGGVGLTLTDIGRPDLSTAFQFNEQAGIGTHYFFTDHIAATGEIRFFHISNAGIASPNRGVNNVMAMVGVSYFW